MNTDLSRFIREIIILKKADVDKYSPDAVRKFFERKHSFLELGILERPKGPMSKEDFQRYVTVNRDQCHFVTKNYKWDSEGNLVTSIANYNPIRSEKVAGALMKETLPFVFVPRILRKRNQDGSYRFDIITFDVCWR